MKKYFVSFKVSQRRITAFIVDDGREVTVSFSYQSPRDQDCKKKGQQQAEKAREEERVLFVPRNTITRDYLLVYALFYSLFYGNSREPGIKWVNKVITDIGRSLRFADAIMEKK